MFWGRDLPVCWDPFLSQSVDSGGSRAVVESIFGLQAVVEDLPVMPWALVSALVEILSSVIV